MNARFLEAARDDLQQAIDFYEAQRVGLGEEFREEVRLTVDRIKAFPEAWRSLSDNTRRCRTRRFPFGIIYQARQDEVLIVAVAHLHRKPSHWRGRL